MHSAGSCYIRVQTTVLMAVIVSSTITGLALFLMGRLRMGSFISFVPFPVQCAFLAACGFKVRRCILPSCSMLASHLTHALLLADLEGWRRVYG